MRPATVTRYAGAWKTISESLDIDFIHDDIHSRSCKKNIFFKVSFLSFGESYGYHSDGELTLKETHKIKW